MLNAPGLAAIVLTEVNPTHDPAGTQLDRYIDTVAIAIRTALSQRIRGRMDLGVP